MSHYGPVMVTGVRMYIRRIIVNPIYSYNLVSCIQICSYVMLRTPLPHSRMEEFCTKFPCTSPDSTLGCD